MLIHVKNLIPCIDTKGQRRYFGKYQCSYCGEFVVTRRDGATMFDSCGCQPMGGSPRGPREARESRGLNTPKKDLLRKEWNRLVNRKDIVLYEPWKSFEVFREYGKKMGFTSGMILRRLDRNKDFSPNNCMFVEKRKRSRHGDATKRGRAKEYTLWQTMKAKCYRPTHGSYNKYGRAGVSVCGEWRNKYPKFKQWLHDNGYSGSERIILIGGSNIFSPYTCQLVPPDSAVQESFNQADNGVVMDCAAQIVSLLEKVSNTKCGPQLADLLTSLYGPVLSNLSKPRREIIRSFIMNSRRL